MRKGKEERPHEQRSFETIRARGLPRQEQEQALAWINDMANEGYVVDQMTLYEHPVATTPASSPTQTETEMWILMFNPNAKEKRHRSAFTIGGA